MARETLREKVERLEEELNQPLWGRVQELEENNITPEEFSEVLATNQELEEENDELNGRVAELEEENVILMQRIEDLYDELEEAKN